MMKQLQTIDIELKVNGNKLIVDPKKRIKTKQRISFRYYEGYCDDTTGGYVFGDKALSENLQYTFSTKSLTFLELL